MAVFDIRRIIDAVETVVQSHNLGSPGAYARWLWQDSKNSRQLGLNEYGCADAANILYTIGRFPRGADERAAWVSALQNFQNPATGMYREKTHHTIHVSAHCIAALELFDAVPLHPLRELEHLAEPSEMEGFLDMLDWRASPWNASHQGAGFYVALVLTGAVDSEWQDRYFAWLRKEFDPETGFLRNGCVKSIRCGERQCLFPHLAGTFHYLFNMEYARRPLPYPDRMIDTCLKIFHGNDFPSLGAAVGFAEIDWVYCMTRSLRQCGHRFAECRTALEKFAEKYISHLNALDFIKHDGVNDLHSLFGAVCALAELQQALPGLVRTERPLKLVLDRRPFI